MPEVDRRGWFGSGESGGGRGTRGVGADVERCTARRGWWVEGYDEHTDLEMELAYPRREVRGVKKR